MAAHELLNAVYDDPRLVIDRDTALYVAEPWTRLQDKYDKLHWSGGGLWGQALARTFRTERETVRVVSEKGVLRPRGRRREPRESPNGNVRVSPDGTVYQTGGAFDHPGGQVSAEDWFAMTEEQQESYRASMASQGEGW
jgi:hypothetical protein